MSKKLEIGPLPTPKARTPVPEEAAARFADPSPAPPPPKVKAPSKLKREGPGERINVYVPPELAKEVRRVCYEEHRSISDCLTEALREWSERKRVKA